MTREEIITKHVAENEKLDRDSKSIRSLLYARDFIERAAGFLDLARNMARDNTEHHGESYAVENAYCMVCNVFYDHKKVLGEAIVAISEGRPFDETLIDSRAASRAADVKAAASDEPKA